MLLAKRLIMTFDDEGSFSPAFGAMAKCAGMQCFTNKTMPNFASAHN